MQAKNQFPFWKFGILLIWISIISGSTSLYAFSSNESNQPFLEKDEFAILELTGPEYLCIIFGGVIGTYSGGGDPTTDVYSWVVTNQNGDEIFKQSGGGTQYETIKVSFNEIGTYQVKLNVRRNNESDFYEETLEVNVKKGPELVLLPDYLLCDGNSVELTAINSTTSNVEEYSIIWKDVLGSELATGNTIQAYYEGYYKVEIFLLNSEGGQDCLITASTFVGPSIDFKVLQSSEEICEGEDIVFSLDTPLSGEWFMRKDNETEKTSLGSGFEKRITSEEINGTGYFEVSFKAFDPEFPDCSSERKKFFFVKDSPKFNLTISSQPLSCSDPSGGFQITTQSDLDSLFIPELGITETNISAGQILPFSNIIPKIYTVSAYQNGCQVTKLIEIAAIPENPSTLLDVQYEETPETCNSRGITPGNLSIKFPTSVTGEFRVLSKRSGIIASGLFNNESSKDITLSDGSYLVELIIGGCTYPFKTIVIEKAEEVDFSIPEIINICEVYDLVPETDQDLLFTLKYPDGREEQVNSDNGFVLTEAGDYELLGVSNDPNLDDCPRVRKFTTTLSQSISFEVELIEEDCFGNKIYEAKIQGISPDQASIRWQNPDGEIVGRSPIFYHSEYGTHSLIVQPLGSGYCPVEKINFEITQPILNVEVELEATKICPVPYQATVSLFTDEEEVTHTEWIFYDLSNNRVNLTQFDDFFEIQAEQEGTYEAVVYNRLGCEIGRSLIEVEESMFTTPPVIEDSYAFCSIKDNTISPIDPGEFAEYKWYFEDQLVSSNPIYKPQDVGDYLLVVTTEDGCEFTAEFSTYDACNFNVVYPNAMVLGNPQKDFRVLLSEGVSEAELFILNRQGSLIHHDIATEIPVESPILQWDGNIEGGTIPSGTYVVIILLRNDEYGFEEKVTSSLLVIK
ncbi:hypothetical protein [Algoriphagus sp.]|uniref:hypothetical protein n=1 Tax=Algoriphagus sp. TaxID=1872435 RepID=UPI0025CF9EC9|nr:hypothetical protein [Algoriphagus sp.]